MASYKARIAAPLEAPVAGGVRRERVPADGPIEARHGLTGSDEAGSGGDD